MEGATNFLSGVLEGFYGRPWTDAQRRELFRRMQVMGLNSYLYAPKDDLKHRAHWQELYSPEEEAQLTSLIASAREHDIQFIYAISPGIDMVFSRPQDCLSLQRKLSQVAAMGCEAFAILFDDIENRLCMQDLEVFKTSAMAQASVTNSLYEHLQKPAIFLFCPTEYCESFCNPNLTNSTYLKTIGAELDPAISLLWTGPIVVSKQISAVSVQALSQLLKRQIVIWDNLHANDYDHRRMFLGPYSGRPLALRRRGLLRGVLINPNCEFEANYIAMHTLAQWTRAAHPEHALCIDPQVDMSDSGDDAAMARHCEQINAKLGTNLVPIYLPQQAQLNALKDWLDLMLYEQHEPQEQNEPGPPISMQNLQLFSDLFYLPSEHGPAALRLLELGHWLRENAQHANCGSEKQQDQIASTLSREWDEKYKEYEQIVLAIARFRDCFEQLQNRGMVYELLPYLNDIHIVLIITLDFLRWLKTGPMNELRGSEQILVCGAAFDPSKFRGGLVAELHRILPLESAQELFPAPNRAFIQPQMTSLSLAIRTATIVRRYRPEVDRLEVYSLCRRRLLARLNLDELLWPEILQDLPGDRYLSTFIQHSPQHCFVVEVAGQIAGFAFASPDVIGWARNRQLQCHTQHWPRYGSQLNVLDQSSIGSLGRSLISFFQKHQKKADLAETVPNDVTGGSLPERKSTEAMECSTGSGKQSPVTNGAENDSVEVSETDFSSIASAHPATMFMEVEEQVLDETSMRLLVCLLASLKTIGAQGVHVQLDEFYHGQVELFKRFGFYFLPPNMSPRLEKTVLLARMN